MGRRIVLIFVANVCDVNQLSRRIPMVRQLLINKLDTIMYPIMYEGYELSGEIALKNNHYYYVYHEMLLKM